VSPAFPKAGIPIAADTAATTANHSLERLGRVTPYICSTPKAQDSPPAWGNAPGLEKNLSVLKKYSHDTEKEE
jgi:hypothetical protein